MSTPTERLSAWARLRRWSILGGLAPLVLGLVVIGVAARDWALVAGGAGGLVLGAIGVVLLVMFPSMWEPANRGRTIAIWIVAGTGLVLIIVIVVFLVA